MSLISIIALCGGDVQTETRTDSDGGTSGPVGRGTPEDEHMHVKKEEPEDEEYLCKRQSSGAQIPVKPELKGFKRSCGVSGGDASNSVENFEQQNGGFQMKNVKEEESDDEDHFCTTYCG